MLVENGEDTSFRVKYEVQQKGDPREIPYGTLVSLGKQRVPTFSLSRMIWSILSSFCKSSLSSPSLKAR